MGSPENGNSNHDGIRAICGSGGFGMQNVPGQEPILESRPGKNGSGNKAMLGKWTFDPEIRNFVFIKVPSK